MSLKKIIKESIDKNPLAIKEAIDEELLSRALLAIKEKMEVNLQEITRTAIKKAITYIGKDGHEHIRIVPIKRVPKEKNTNLDKIRSDEDDN